jgi:protein subunit release factor A
VVQDIALYQGYAKELARIRSTAQKYEDYLKIKSDIEGLRGELVKHEGEEDFTALINEELSGLSESASSLEKNLKRYSLKATVIPTGTSSWRSAPGPAALRPRFCL